MAEPKEKRARGAKTSYSNILAIVDWLDKKENFNLIVGASQKNQKTVVAGSKLKKKDAYESLAEHVNQICGTSWDCDTCESRYRACLDKYRSARDAYKDKSGQKFGLTSEEVSRGVTIDDKLNKLCPLFSRWDALFGERPNFNPPFLFESLNFDEDNGSLYDPDVEDGEEESAFLIAGGSSSSSASLPLSAPPPVSAPPQVSIPVNPPVATTGAVTVPVGPVTPMPTHLRELAAEAARQATEAGHPNNVRGAGTKRDFGSVYASSAEKRTQMQCDQAKDELEWKKSQAREDLELKREELKQAKEKCDMDARLADMRAHNEMLMEMMRMKMPPDEARQYLSMMKSLKD